MSTGKQSLDVVIGDTGGGALGKCLLPFGEVRRLRQQRQGFRLKRWWLFGFDDHHRQTRAAGGEQVGNGEN